MEEEHSEKERQLAQFQALLSKQRGIVFFGGAGVSTESGIPDFRSVDGLYHQVYQEPPETILSHTYFMRKPEAFYRFYKDKMNCLDAKPNVTHRKLAQLEQNGQLDAIVTQNIDGLHQAAGSRTVYELHGSIHRNYCMQCGAFYDARAVFSAPSLPHCSCGGLIKPDVVLYEEGLDEAVLEGAIRAIMAARLLIVGGTSLSVYPAAGLLRYFNGDKLIVINKTPTPYDRHADLLLQLRLGEAFSALPE